MTHVEICARPYRTRPRRRRDIAFGEESDVRGDAVAEIAVAGAARSSGAAGRGVRA